MSSPGRDRPQRPGDPTRKRPLIMGGLIGFATVAIASVLLGVVAFAISYLATLVD